MSYNCSLCLKCFVSFVCIRCTEKRRHAFCVCESMYMRGSYSVQCSTGPLGLSLAAFFSGRVLNSLQSRAIQMRWCVLFWGFFLAWMIFLFCFSFFFYYFNPKWSIDCTPGGTGKGEDSVDIESHLYNAGE